MPAIDPLVAQKRALRLIASALHTGSLPHAFLLTGQEGIGKRAAAVAFSMAANCERSYRDAGNADASRAIPAAAKPLWSCGQCRTCKKIMAGNHPDMHVIEPSGRMIKVDQVRALCRKLALKPYEAALRVAVILGAQTLNPEAGNTLLKTLEEPPDRTVFVLTAFQTSDLLPTIVSRCRHIRFAPLPRDLLSRHLESRYGIAPITAGAIASMADGSLTRACKMAETNWAGHRRRIIEQMESATTPGEKLIFSEFLARNRETLPEALCIMQSWFRDLIVSRIDPGKTIHRDLSDQMTACGARYRSLSLISKINAIAAAQQDIQANANVRLTLDALMLSLAMKD